MAAVARAQSAGSMGIKIALVVFICIAVASLTFTVILYTQHEDKTAAVEQAQSSQRRAMDSLRQTQQQLQQVANMVIGQETDDIAVITQDITSARQQVASSSQIQDAQVSIAADAPLMTVLDGLFQALSACQEQRTQLQSDYQQIQQQMNQLQTAADEREEDYSAQIDDLEERYASLETQSQANQKAWQQQVEQLQAKLDEAGQSASQQLRQERQLRQDLEAQLAQNEQRIKELTEKLASFRPSGQELALLQLADGKVVHVVPTENIAYINLGKNQGVEPGMTFTVYARQKGIPESGQGKATLEVVNAFESTSETRITATQPNQPVVENDLVANPVFDQTRKYHFVVAGDFDLDFDGEIEDTNGQQVAQLIRKTGGEVMDQIDTRTDFVVLGAPPDVPEELPPNVKGIDRDAWAERRQEAMAEREKFEKIVETANSLSIPKLNRTQFVQFMGLGLDSSQGG